MSRLHTCVCECVYIYIYIYIYKHSDVNICLVKVWTTIGWLSIIWMSDLSHEIKQNFFQAVAVSILLYGYTTWTLIKHKERKLERNYTRMLPVILNKSWKQHPTKKLLYSHLLLISQTLKITAHAGLCWRSKHELIIDILQ